MLFPQPLLPARFVRRKKRFFIHAEADDGTPLVAHTNNTGRLTGCLHPGGRIWLSPAENPRRRLRWTLEITETPAGIPIGVNTALANRVAEEAIAAGLVPALADLPPARREVVYGSRGSRADLLLDDHGRRTWVEVKNVSLVDAGHGRFPDAPSERARKHLLELADAVARGDRAVLLFCSQRPDTRTVGPADDVDPQYGALLRQVRAAGVEVCGIGCRVTPAGICADRSLAVVMRNPPV